MNQSWREIFQNRTSPSPLAAIIWICRHLFRVLAPKWPFLHYRFVMRKPRQNAIISGIKWHINQELSKRALGSCGMSHVSTVEGWEVHGERATQGHWGNLMNKGRKKCYATKVTHVREKFCLLATCIQLTQTEDSHWLPCLCPTVSLKLCVSLELSPCPAPT